MPADVVSSSARGAGFLILLQIFSRALTFAVNQILLRFLSPTLLGASVQLELYIISAHHFARESIRVACQRLPEDGIQASINLSYLALAGGIPTVFGLAQWYAKKSLDVPYYSESLQICQLAAIFELLSEPAFVAVQQNMLYKTRAAAEASAVMLKTCTTAAVLFWAHHSQSELGVLPFAFGELAYCTALSVVYIWQTSSVLEKQGVSLLPMRFSESPRFWFSLFSKSLLNLSASLYVQSAIKYVLTQGDVIVSTALASLEAQGMYALAANYGGLIARMVFRPIEDSSRNLFAQLCTPTAATAKVENNYSKGKGHGSKAKQPTSDIKRAASILRDILRIYNIVGLLAFAIGPTAAPLLLRLVAGSRWSDSGAGDVLGTYCYSIPLLAINGVSEAFVAATASTKELHWQSIWMGAFSAGFAASAYFFLRVLALGAKGLVWSNCVNMSLRIVFNLVFVRKFFAMKGEEFKLTDLVPSIYATSASVIVPNLLIRAKGLFAHHGLLGELLPVVGVGATLTGFIAITERRFLLDCFKRYKS